MIRVVKKCINCSSRPRLRLEIILNESQRNWMYRLRVFENRMLRRIFRPEGGSDRWLEKLHNFYSPARIIRMIKSLEMKWIGHVVRMGKQKFTHNSGPKT
jgi:hypothetical protein